MNVGLVEPLVVIDAATDEVPVLAWVEAAVVVNVIVGVRAPLDVAVVVVAIVEDAVAVDVTVVDGDVVFKVVAELVCDAVTVLVAVADRVVVADEESEDATVDVVVVVALEVCVVVGAVRAHSSKAPSRHDSIALFSTTALLSQSDGAIKSSPRVHATPESVTVSREHALMAALK